MVSSRDIKSVCQIYGNSTDKHSTKLKKRSVFIPEKVLYVNRRVKRRKRLK